MDNPLGREQTGNSWMERYQNQTKNRSGKRNDLSFSAHIWQQQIMEFRETVTSDEK